MTVCAVDNASSMNLATEMMHAFVSHPRHLSCVDILSPHTLSVNTVLDLPKTAKTADAARRIVSQYQKVNTDL